MNPFNPKLNDLCFRSDDDSCFHLYFRIDWKVSCRNSVQLNEFIAIFVSGSATENVKHVP